MKKHVESLKAVVIVLLVVTMLVLWTANMSLHFPDKTAEGSQRASISPDLWIFETSAVAPSTTSARSEYFSPASVTLVTGGSVYTSRTNSALTRTLFENEEPLIKEVFSSSYHASRSSEKRWNEVLRMDSIVLIELLSPLPYQTVSAFLGKTSGFATGELCLVKQLILYPDKDNTVSALVHDGSGGYFSFTSTLDPESSLKYDFNSNNLTAYTVNEGFLNAFFAYSQPDTALLLPPHHAVLTDKLVLRDVTVENRIKEIFEKFDSSDAVNHLTLISDPTVVALLGAFDINPSTVGLYTDANARFIFINSSSRLAIGRDGMIEYSVSEEEGALITLAALLESEKTDFSSFEVLSAATAFLNRLRPDFILGDTELLLENVRYESSQMVLSFGYYNDLCPIQTSVTESPVTLYFDKNGLVRASVSPMVITDVSEGTALPEGEINVDMPEALVAKLLSADSPLTALEPEYKTSDSDGRLTPVWTARVTNGGDGE